MPSLFLSSDQKIFVVMLDFTAKKWYTHVVINFVTIGMRS